MKTLFLLCLLTFCAFYGCQRAMDVGVITNVEEPGIKVIPPRQLEQPKSPSMAPKEQLPKKVLPFTVDPDHIINI